jgi:hypothetical protein
VTAAESYQADVGIGGTIAQSAATWGGCDDDRRDREYLFPGGIGDPRYVDLGEDLLGHRTTDDFSSTAPRRAAA